MNISLNLVVQAPDHLGVSYSQLSVVALKAIQELSSKNSELQAVINSQQEAIDKLSAQVNQILIRKQ